MAVLAKAPMVLAVDAFRAQLGRVLAAARARQRPARLSRARRIVPENERLTQALERTQQRYDETPENERVYAPIDAIRELARFCANSCSLALQLYDLEFLDSLPSLEPLLPLVAGADRGHAARRWPARETLRGRTFEAKRIYERVLTRMAQPDRAGFDDAYFRGIRLGLHYLLGLVEASMGIASAERHAQVLESDREHRVNAWRVRMPLLLNQGNADEARKCQRRAELLAAARRQGPALHRHQRRLRAASRTRSPATCSASSARSTRSPNSPRTIPAGARFLCSASATIAGCKATWPVRSRSCCPCSSKAT